MCIKPGNLDNKSLIILYKLRKLFLFMLHSRNEDKKYTKITIHFRASFRFFNIRCLESLSIAKIYWDYYKHYFQFCIWSLVKKFGNKRKSSAFISKFATEKRGLLIRIHFWVGKSGHRRAA